MKSLGKPTISNQPRNRSKPLYKRYNKILVAKEHKLSMMREEVEMVRRIKDPEEYNPTFKPDTSVSQNNVSKPNRGDFNSFLRDLNVWQHKKE
jgi:hypothetical protein